MDPTMRQQVMWTEGPATVDLGGVADLQVPESYHFADPAAARSLMNNNVPPGLVGILAPKAGGAPVILQYVPAGFFRTSADETINADAVLADVQSKIGEQNAQRARQHQAGIKSISWQKAPVFDATDHSLEWAFRVESASSSINHSLRLFSRGGILMAMISSDSEPIALKDLMKNVTFKEGQRYSDYQPGDKLAPIELTQLITGSEFPTISKRGWLANVTRNQMIWISCGAAACVLTIVGFLVSREIRSLKQHKSFDPHPHMNGKIFANGHSNGSRASRRKRTFDYQKFYADMVTQVSCRSAGSSADTQSLVNGRENRQVETRDAGALNTINELIAQQKDFIEEQRRLMQQQAKLIEERSRLIEEKNQLLAKQNEMMEPHLL